MALTDKDIVITPNRGQSADPKVEFKGASSTLGPQTISLNVYPTSNGTLSFEGSAGQLFSITNTLTGTIYSVNDVSGIPSIEVLDTGLVKLAQYSGNVLIGTATDTGHKVRVAGTTRIDGGGSQPLTISTSSSSPWAFGLIRTDTGADSKIFLHNPGSGSAWVFEHIPYFYNSGNYNVPLHNGNYGSYALPLSGGTLTGNLTMNGAGNSTSIIFGENTKQINVEGYWMMFKGHQNEGFRWQTTDGSTYTTRMQLTSSNLTLNTNGFIDFGPNTTWSSTLRVGGNGHGGSGRASVVTTDGNLHLDGGGSGTGLYLNYYVNGPIYATSSAHVVIHAGNYNSYSPTLTGGGASGTWPISITGNAATATSATDSTKLPLAGGTMTGSVSQGTYNVPLIKSVASGSGSAGAGFAIQQTTNEGWTGIFVDYEPYTGWGLYHDNPNNYFSITAESDTNSLRSFTVPSVSSGNRTAHEKIRFQQADGRIVQNSWTTYGRNYSHEWIEFPNYSGLYSPNQGAHFYPNNGGSYGSWRIAGTKNNWYGIYFDSGSTLMMNSSEVGFYREGHGWQMWWSGGTGYVQKGSPGGGTQATILDSSNYTNYSHSISTSDSRYHRKDTTNQWIKPYYEYGNYLTTETPQSLVSQMGGGGLRIDFMHPSYTGSGNWNHVITWSGYNLYNMYQLGGNYDGGTGTDLWVRSEANHGGTSWTAWRRLLNSSNYNSYSPTLTGGNASGTWSINITGSAGYATTAGSVPASGITGQVGMWTSPQRPGPYRLYRRDNDSNYSVQTYWTGTYWRLYGYSGDDGHADTHVGYAESAGSSGNATTADKVKSFPGYTHPGTGMYPFYNWGGSNGGANEPSASSYTLGISVGSHPSDQAYGFQIARNMWNTGLWTRGYDSGFGGWVRLLDSSNYNSYSPTLTGGNASGTWPINITGTGTDPSKVPIAGGTMTGTLFINSKLRVNNASGPSDSTYGTAADIPMHMSGNTRTQTTFLIENTVNSSIDYPVIVIRRTLTPVGSRFGGMIRFADKNSSGTEISSQIYSFNRLTSQDLFLDAGSGTEDRVVLRAGSSSSMQVAENFIMNVKAAIYTTSTPAALDIDCKQSNYFTKTISADSTFTFSNVPAPSGFTIAYSFTLELTHTAGTVTWPASVRWPGNVLPSLTTGKTHLFMFVTDDSGSRWRGSFLSNYDN